MRQTMADSRRIRVLIAKLGCDIHERGALTLLTMLRDAGMEVIYTGRYQTPQAVANVALTEDVDLIALSDHTGSLPIIASSVLEELRALDCADIPVIAGGLLSPGDVRALEAMGVSGNYGPGTPIDVIIDHIRERALRRHRAAGVSSESAFADGR
jgi:methylmalonyl-CoA mutase, C-terminal domain